MKTARDRQAIFLNIELFLNSIYFIKFLISMTTFFYFDGLQEL